MFKMILSIIYQNDVFKMFQLKDTTANLNEISKIANSLNGVAFNKDKCLFICKNKTTAQLIYSFYRIKLTEGSI